jgi:hypothetical protein
MLTSNKTQFNLILKEFLLAHAIILLTNLEMFKYRFALYLLLIQLKSSVLSTLNTNGI